MVKTTSIELPEEITDLFSKKELETSVRRWAVLELVRTGKLSSGKAAEVLGMTRWDFMELMSDQNIPMADFPEDELERQMKEKAGS